MHAREREGIVTAGAEAEALLKEIKEKLLAVRDPKNNLPPITRVDFATDAYQGPYAHDGPDALVGYNRGYRAGWPTILGSLPPDILEANTDPCGGDHCMNSRLV